MTGEPLSVKKGEGRGLCFLRRITPVERIEKVGKRMVVEKGGNVPSARTERSVGGGGFC